MGTISEVYFSRGETVGEARGRAEGAAEKTDEMIRNMLAEKFPLDAIVRGSGKPLEYVQVLV